MKQELRKINTRIKKGERIKVVALRSWAFDNAEKLDKMTDKERATLVCQYVDCSLTMAGKIIRQMITFKKYRGEFKQ
jgi:hypothetical protein